MSMSQVDDAGVKSHERNGDDGEAWAMLGGVLALAASSAVLLAWQVATPRAIGLAGITLDRLGAALTLLVGGVGAVTFRFSMRYLDGEPIRRRFLRRLAFTISSAYVLMLATDLRLLIAAWATTSLGLHGLLLSYPDRAEAWRPARKKFLISRLGDAALVAAAALVWRDWGTFDLGAFLRAATAGPVVGPSATAICLLVAAAALTKSAQFPFHSWLPETMEAPTPVSALMHAGVINAGGALLLRFAPLVVRVPEALLLLSLVGTITAVLGMLAMWAQVKVKRTLAWSTVAQMGFMMVQCGLAAFPAALLHILGHGCYKAWSFLRSGGLPASAPSVEVVPPARTLGLAALGTGWGILTVAAASALTGFRPDHAPGELALAAVAALSIGQLWVVLLGPSRPGRSTFIRLPWAAAASLAASVAIFALYRGAERFLAPVLGDPPAPEGALAWLAATIPAVAFTGLVVVHALLPALGRRASGRAFHVHALHGFYLGAVADRLVDRAWGRRIPKGAEHA
ncbi:proton-conducting transporter transmembrane domain-containing protein [Paludisphaera mucosa]|uniref:Probable inorganic carbon transporter subunit DabB n=1 Tax=Paludisphaera mucosa TaxID=3030827 RepID=A0ABT6F9Q3_9BACT|nr:proton-conducting transporter membrane subunit [Paludisphaera mucosa]MDG3004321.1 proton-conducting transporter membrane subunit [Paludisphaera mucosa]